MPPTLRTTTVAAGRAIGVHPRPPWFQPVAHEGGNPQVDPDGGEIEMAIGMDDSGPDGDCDTETATETETDTDSDTHCFRIGVFA